jgi:arginyl-tRNA synthetase
MVTAATQTQFGDYQVNAALRLAKPLSLKPRDCAKLLLAALASQPSVAAHFEPPTIAGPGFINLRVKTSSLASSVSAMAASGRLAVPATPSPQRVVVDYSSPNVAKEMHAGHLRSTIIGDSLANLLEFLGHTVLRLNHVGDWGTQFGMLLTHLNEVQPDAAANGAEIADLVEFYKEAKQRFDADPDFKARSQQAVVKLQSGDPQSLASWRTLCECSRAEYAKIYERLNIRNLVERGESFYNGTLPEIVKDLEDSKVAEKSEGALCVFLDGFKTKNGSPLPLLVQKSDGGFNYATTDLAAIKQRVGVEKADRVLYVTDAGQAQHFQMVFAAAAKANLVEASRTSLEHVPFGLVQGEDGKKFATRSGDTVKLKDLLDEAVRRVADDLRNRSDVVTELPEDLQNMCDVIGISAVKYADLQVNRESNYKFSYDRMLSLQGNTAPYMLYAYTRIRSICKNAVEGRKDVDWKAGEWPGLNLDAEVQLGAAEEIELARNLVKFTDVLRDVEQSLLPNRLCDYLFDTSQKFSRFYEKCSVNNAESEQVKQSRLVLCVVTGKVLERSLGLLGIDVLDKM